MTERVRVIDAAGRALAATTPARAAKLVAAGRAVEVAASVPTIKLADTVDFTPRVPEPATDWTGTRLLLHSCCAPCTTYTQKRLREVGFDIAVFWYNPNIFPRAEYDLRRAALQHFSSMVNLPVIWDAKDADWAQGNARWQVEIERGGELEAPARCAVCYRIRLARTAAVAAAQGFSHFTTTLLISPYQDLDLIRAVGEAVGAVHGVSFYFENLRSGYGESRRLLKEHKLYAQKYCGCVYSSTA